MTQTQTAEPAPVKRHRSRKFSAEPLAVVPSDDQLGEKMLACTPKQRRFVMEMLFGPGGPDTYGATIRAARAAGYAASSDDSLRVTAHQVLHSPRVQAALVECGFKLVKAESIASWKTVIAIARDLTHRDCLKANIEVLNRAGFAIETVHHINVHKSTPEMILVASEKVIERIQELAMQVGLDSAKQIEAVKQINGNKTPIAE
jgi:hypothetical protein